MSEYIVSARKYRPDSFESLLGQETVAQTLKNSIIRGKLAHAYLFCGPRGVGKTSAARIFAKIINCENPTPDLEPCGVCESCVSFKDGRSFSIHEMDAASNNSVEDIKELISMVNMPPYVGRYNVFIVDEVHMLSTAAFNAFLKTLEEPPSHAVFILATTEKHKIPATIMSRCQTFDFNRISIRDIVKNLKDIASKENVSVDDESLHVIAAKADGAMRDALTIFDQTVAFCGNDIKYSDVIKNLNVLDYEYAFKLVDCFLEGDYSTALMVFDEVLSKGFNSLYFVSYLGEHFRNLLVGKSGGRLLPEMPESFMDRFARQAEKCSVAFLYQALSIANQCENGYRGSVNQRLHIEFALIKLCFIELKNASEGVQSGISGRVAEAPGINGDAKVPLKQEMPGQKIPKQNSMPGLQDNITPASAESGAPATENTNSQETSSAENPEIKENKSVSDTQSEGTKKRRTRKSASVLSLSEELDNLDGNDNKSETPALTGEKPDDELIKSKWEEFLRDIVDMPKLVSTLKARPVTITDKGDVKEVSVGVYNISQKMWIDSNKLNYLESEMMKKVDSRRLKLNIYVIEDDTEKPVYMSSSEKAKAMMKENNMVNALVKELNLEII